MWRGWKKDKRRSRLLGIGTNEREILADHAEGGIHGSRNSPSTYSMKQRKRRSRRRRRRRRRKSLSSPQEAHHLSQRQYNTYRRL
jgi:hypothetical protein